MLLIKNYILPESVSLLCLEKLSSQNLNSCFISCHFFLPYCKILDYNGTEVITKIVNLAYKNDLL